MTSTTDSQQQIQPFPDHNQLPESDGPFVKTFQEHPQSILLTDTIEPLLQQRHPNGWYCIGQDCGIYWRMCDPPERGAEAPDWFYVVNVPPTINGQIRRSYVLWQEFIPPLIVLEFVTPLGPPYRREDKENFLLDEGLEERDQTPLFAADGSLQKPGKFWIYEQVIRPPFYGIYQVKKASVEVYHLVEGQYHLLPTNERGHYSITPLSLELGIWQGQYQNLELPWLRWWDEQGNLLLTGHEKADRLAAQLRAAGIEPEV